jgi:hypothetical protein
MSSGYGKGFEASVGQVRGSVIARNRCGPSRRSARDASAVLKNFVRRGDILPLDLTIRTSLLHCRKTEKPNIYTSTEAILGIPGYSSLPQALYADHIVIWR